MSIKPHFNLKVVATSYDLWQARHPDNTLSTLATALLSFCHVSCLGHSL